MITIDYMSLAVATALIALFVVPLYLHIRKNNQTKSKALKRVEDFATSEGLVLTDRDTWRNHYFLGLDRAKRTLVYSDNMANGTPVCIDLGPIQRVRLVERFHEVASNAEKRKVFDSIELHLLARDERVAYRLEVYDGDRYSDLDGEAVLGRKWELLLREQLQKAQNPSLA